MNVGEEYAIWSRADGEPIGDFDWVSTTDFFEEDEYWAPVRLKQRIVKVIHETEVVWYPLHWTEPCGSCDSRGFFVNDSGEDEECPECNGEGGIEHERPDDHLRGNP